MIDKIPPYFHFYPDAYWGDEKASLLTYEQHGLYIFLLSHQWREGSIPPDLPTLAKLCRLDGTAMAQLWHGLDQCFKSYKGRLINPRLNRERQKLISYFKAQSDKGKLGASATWANKLKRRAMPKAQLRPGDGTAMATKRAYSFSYLKTFLEKLNDKEKALKFSETWNLWEKHRKEKRNALTPTTIEKQLAFLEKQPDPIAVINQSIEKGWTGLFELKTNGHQEGKTPAGGVRGETGKYDERMAAARRESEL